MFVPFQAKLNKIVTQALVYLVTYSILFTVRFVKNASVELNSNLSPGRVLVVIFFIYIYILLWYFKLHF